MSRPIADRGSAVAQIAEVFRERGYEGTSLAHISAATGLGKGSLYHFFPGGKEQMASEVLASVDAWFETQVFAPLRDTSDARRAIDIMLDQVSDYFRSGGRICLVGAFALNAARDRFASPIQSYFSRWTSSLAEALERGGHPDAWASAEGLVVDVQGALVLSRALGDGAVFQRLLVVVRRRLESVP